MEALTELPKDMAEAIATQWGGISMEIAEENEIFIFFNNDDVMEDLPDDQIPYFYEGYLKIPFTNRRLSAYIDNIRTTFNVLLTKGEVENMKGIHIQRALILALKGQGMKVIGKDVDLLLEASLES